MQYKKWSTHTRQGSQQSLSDLENKYIGSQKRADRGFSVRIAQVININEQAMTCHLRFIDDDQVASHVPWTMANWTPRSGTFSAPDKDCHVLVGFARWGSNFTKPYILGYLPAGFKGGMRFDPRQVHLDSQIHRDISSKVYPGETKIVSQQGSVITADDDIHLKNKRLNELGIRSIDQAVLMKSVQWYVSTNAGKIWNGVTYRQDSIEPPVPMADKWFLPSNQKYYYIITVDNTQWDIPNPSDAVPWTEHRQMFEEFGAYGTQAVTEEHDSDARDLKDPFWRHNKFESSPYELLEEVWGTNVSNEPKYESERYGYPTVPQVWTNIEAVGDSGNDLRPRLDEMSYAEVENGGAFQSGLWLDEIPVDSVDIKLKRGFAYRRRMRKTKSHYDLDSWDKEGKHFVHLGMSGDTDPLGAGRSMEWSSEGSLKFVVGKNVDQGKSIQFDSRGGAKIHLGFDKKKNERIYVRHLDTPAYGGFNQPGKKVASCVLDCETQDENTPGHGYHGDIKDTAKEAPKTGQNPQDPQFDGLSLDLNIDKNTHIIMGSDDDQNKSWVLDTKSAVVWRLGKEKTINDDSFLMQTDGGLEFVFGKDKDNCRSIDMNCLGGIQVNIADGDCHQPCSPRSLQVTMAKGMYWKVDAPDGCKHALFMYLNGPTSINVIKGDLDINVLDGNLKAYVNGAITVGATKTITLNSQEDIVLNAKKKILLNSDKDVTVGIAT